MNNELKEILEENYQYAIDAQKEDMAEAEQSAEDGIMERYFDLSLCLQLADCCWALEKWDEAKKWYRHNSRIFRERRDWFTEKEKQDSINALLDWETITYVRAGELETGKAMLSQAIEFFKEGSGNELILSTLGMHAAQTGMNELSVYVDSAVDARKQLQRENNPEILKKIEPLHYEPAMAMLLSGKWDEFLSHVEKLKEAKKFMTGNPQLVFPPDLQKALLSGSDGLIAIGAIYQAQHKDDLSANAVQAFEEAMLNFYRFSAQIDADMYFMRLASRFAGELKEHKKINPNPFAD